MYYGDYEITKREVIVSISIFCIFMILGIILSSKIQNSAEDSNLKYEQAIHITSDKEFDHGLKTSIGSAFCQGIIKADNPVSMENVDGQYMYLKCVEEHYEEHTRIEEDEDGEEEVETYYSWDYYDSTEKQTDTVSFLGRNFDYNLFANMCDTQYIKTYQSSAFSDVRYVYYGTPVDVNATLYGNLSNNTFEGRIRLFENTSIDEALEGLLKTPIALVSVFWFMWIALTGAAIFGFYYLDNNWLNS